MGTRSAIAVNHSGVIKAVYCHWDGYLDHNGRILLEHYNSPKANHLISMGDMSYLGEEIGEQHDFNDDSHPEWCKFYARDRGEDPADWSVFHSRDEYMSEMGHRGCDYLYLIDNGIWYVSQRGRDFELLETAIENMEMIDAKLVLE